MEETLNIPSLPTMPISTERPFPTLAIIEMRPLVGKNTCSAMAPASWIDLIGIQRDGFQAKPFADLRGQRCREDGFRRGCYVMIAAT